MQLATRSFFGIYRVYYNAERDMNIFLHGSTVHGLQFASQGKAQQPAMYYHVDGPFGQLFRALSPVLTNQPVAIIGLGTGGLACYGSQGSSWTHYEIDPVVENIARDTRFFTYLRDCPPTTRVVSGDARIALQDAPDHHYVLMIVDAFTLDAIPTHLLTREALSLYSRKLAPGGVLAIHISNRYLDLAPVIGNLARDAGLVGRVNKLRVLENVTCSRQVPRISRSSPLARQT
jgi:hypothetical protein